MSGLKKRGDAAVTRAPLRSLSKCCDSEHSNDAADLQVMPLEGFKLIYRGKAIGYFLVDDDARLGGDLVMGHYPTLDDAHGAAMVSRDLVAEEGAAS